MCLVPVFRTVILAAAMLACGVARAQIITQNLSALGGPPDDPAMDALQADTLQRYAAQGWNFGPLSVHGYASQGVGYTNNADRLYGGHPSVALQTNAELGGRLLETAGRTDVMLSVNSLHYPSRSIQDRTNWTAGLQGYRDFGMNRLSYSYNHQKLTQMPTDLGAAALDRPVPYRLDAFDLNLLVPTRGRISIVPDVRLNSFNFDNMSTTDPYLRQAYRNRVVVSEGAALRYALADDSALLALMQGTEIRYTNDQLHLPSRDSNGLAALAGYEYSGAGLWRVRMVGGYQYRRYASALYKPIDTFYAEVDGRWVPTRLTQVTFSLSRGIADSAAESVVGFIYTTASVRVRHVYARNIVLEAGVSVQQGGGPSTPEIFRGTPLYMERRSQSNVAFDLSGGWSIDRHFVLGLQNQFLNANAVGSTRYNIDTATLTLHYYL
ncbi:outer membrane beta-barrel protein [Acidomonas methanolica]|nr:outer membrane beta-barrel protein [Acidomonas methanolica]